MSAMTGVPQSATTGAPSSIRTRARAPLARTLSRGDRVLLALCVAAGLLVMLSLAEIVYQIVTGAQPAISRYGLPFVGQQAWAPNFNRFGAAVPLFGTFVAGFIALALATPLGIAIALYLALMAPSAVRSVVGPLVEMLAAIPSVIVGFWGLIVLAPFLQKHVEPALHSALGFLPIFGPPQTTGLSIFAAGLVLTLMILPIIASLSRDLFLTVPRELREGAEALGATRWEVIRGIVLPTTVSGVAAATMLGLGRALGEAIAVTEVVGAGTQIHASVFQPGYTLASRIALDFQDVTSPQHQQSLFYLALLLLIIGVTTNLLAQTITNRYERSRAR